MKNARERSDGSGDWPSLGIRDPGRSWVGLGELAGVMSNQAADWRRHQAGTVVSVMALQRGGADSPWPASHTVAAYWWKCVMDESHCREASLRAGSL